MYHTQEVIGLNTGFRLSTSSEGAPDSNVEFNYQKIRFGELEIGGLFVFHGEELIKTGDYSATNARMRNRSEFLFFKRDLVSVKATDSDDEIHVPFDLDPEQTKFIKSLADTLLDGVSTTSSPRPLFSNYTVETGDQLHIRWKCLAVLSGVATFDVFLQTVHNGTYTLLEDKDIRSYFESWVVPIPDLRFRRGTLTDCSVTLSFEHILLTTDKFTQMFDKKVKPGDTCIIMLQNVYGEPPVYHNNA